MEYDDMDPQLIPSPSRRSNAPTNDPLIGNTTCIKETWKDKQAKILVSRTIDIDALLNVRVLDINLLSEGDNSSKDVVISLFI